MINCYSLTSVRIKSEGIYARPVGWDRPDEDGFGNGKNGRPIQAIEWHTTCPFCGNLIHFGLDSLYVAEDGSANNIRCEECNSGNPFKKSQSDPEPPKDRMVLEDKTASWSFPGGELDLIDWEKLALVDAELAKSL